MTPDKHGQTLNVTVKQSLADKQGHGESPRKLHKGTAWEVNIISKGPHKTSSESSQAAGNPVAGGGNTVTGAVLEHCGARALRLWIPKG